MDCDRLVMLPDGMSHGEAMARLRQWLDRTKIELRDFRVATHDNRRAIEITFKSDVDAARFDRECGAFFP